MCFVSHCKKTKRKSPQKQKHSDELDGKVFPLSKNTILKQQYVGSDGCEWRTKASNVYEVNLTPHTVYLIAAVPEMREEEERLTALNKSDLAVSDPNMRTGQIHSSPRSMSQSI